VFTGRQFRVAGFPSISFRMQLFVTALNSGSNANCFYIGTEEEAIFVDAGLSCRETEKRMKRLGLSMEKVKAIFVSHEHSDHIRGIPGISKKHQLPVYITPRTLEHARLSPNIPHIMPFQAYEPVQVGGLSITAFPKFHDASDPHSFVVSFQGLNIGVFTDIGAPCEHVIKHFKLCHAMFLEANYDDAMLTAGRYPAFLKMRIQGNKGHLSNQQALDLFRTHKPPFMSHLFLSHLSKDNNCPELVKELFEAQSNGTEVVVASRFEETQLYRIALPKKALQA
jgi:phosphoribosyl 1,2-cyclic phosphodiesterase